MSDLPLTGGCLCGGVRFRGDRSSRLGRLLPLHAVSAPHRHRRGRLGPPRPRLASDRERRRAHRSYVPDDGFAKDFCSACGSALWSRNPSDPDWVSVRLGAFDADPGIRPSYRQFVAYALAWEPIPDDGLPCFPERRPPA